MNAPDKFYIQPRTIDELPRQNIIYTKRLSDTSIEYIRKDALLDWAKEKKKQLFEQESENDEPSDVAAGINAGLDMVIDKLNSM